MEQDFQPDFRVNLARLRPGTHTFRFQATEALFRDFENPDVGQAQVDVQLTVVRSETNADFRLAVQGTLQLACDRCLEQYPYSIDFQHRIVYSTDESLKASEDTEVVYLAPGRDFVDIKQDLYDLLVLHIPYRKVPCATVEDCAICPPALKPLLLNIQSTVLPEVLPAEQDVTEAPDTSIDPRWAKLLSLKKNQQN